MGGAAAATSKAAALKLADTLAKEKGIDLKFYPERDAQYFARSNRPGSGPYWSVYYTRNPSGGEGDFFVITVDDKTGEVHHWGGLAP